MRVLEISDHPARTTHATRRAGPGVGAPPNGGELIPRQDEGQVPLCGGVARSAGVVYSIAQGCSNSYMPVVSVYDTPTGAYIMHEPSGLVTRQLVAVPADV